MAGVFEKRKYINICAIAKDRFMREANVPAEMEGWFVNELGYICLELDGEIRQFANEKSENAFTKFVYNNDGRYKERIALINQCIHLMATLQLKEQYFKQFITDPIANKLLSTVSGTEEVTWNRLSVHTASIDTLVHIRDMLLEMHNDFNKKYPDGYVPEEHIHDEGETEE